MKVDQQRQFSYTRTFLSAGPGATVHNITLQDG